MVSEQLVSDMFFRCYFSEGFAEVKMHIKVYVGEEKSMVEVRKLNGCSELFINTYRSFKNFMLYENKRSHSMKPFQLLSLDAPISKTEEEASILSVLRWTKKNPMDGIKCVSTIAMEKEECVQNRMFNEVIKIINEHDEVDLIAPQILGFIDTMKTNPYFKLGQEYRNANIPLLKQLLMRDIKEIKNKSVQLRIQEL